MIPHIIGQFLFFHLNIPCVSALLRVSVNDVPNLCFHSLYLLVKLRRRHTVCAVSEDYDLLRPVRGGNTYTMLLCELVRCLFNVHIRSFRFFRVNDGYAAHLLNLSVVALYPVSVKNKNDLAFFLSPVIAHKLYQPAAGKVKVISRQLFKLVP